jgi:hypothetical protein
MGSADPGLPDILHTSIGVLNTGTHNMPLDEKRAY